MNYTPPPYSQFSASHKAQQQIYQKVQSKTGRTTWYVPTDTDRYDWSIQVDAHDPDSQGYAGRTLEFRLDNGTTTKVKGPWQSNADALFSVTGIDLRDKFWSLVVLSKAIENINGIRTFIDVVYKDDKPVQGSFFRYRELIKKHPEAKYYYSATRGGASSGPCNN